MLGLNISLYFSFKIRIHLLVFLFGAITAQEYIPGTPGAPWTLEETLVIKAKLNAIYHKWGGHDALRELYGNTNGSNWQDVPTAEKALRLGFHDCLKYSDGSGGCDGCLNWDGVGKRWTGFGKMNFPVQTNTDNNGLEYMVDVLEGIYTDAKFPKVCSL